MTSAPALCPALTRPMPLPPPTPLLGALSVGTERALVWLPCTPLSLDALELRRQMDDTDSKGGSLSFAKTLRLVRLAKMLRVARLKRIVGRHASLVEFSAYVRGRLSSLDPEPPLFKLSC